MGAPICKICRDKRQGLFSGRPHLDVNREPMVGRKPVHVGYTAAASTPPTVTRNSRSPVTAITTNKVTPDQKEDFQFHGPLPPAPPARTQQPTAGPPPFTEMSFSARCCQRNVRTNTPRPVLRPPTSPPNNGPPTATPNRLNQAQQTTHLRCKKGHLHLGKKNVSD